MKRIIFILGVILFMGASFLAVSRYRTKPLPAPTSERMAITTTLFPLYDMAKNIGQDKADVSLLLPPGTEAHSFDPKPSDIVRINQSDLFIFTGKFMEPWAEDLAKGVSNKNLVAVDSSFSTTMIPGVFHDADEPAGSLDPHIWLDFDNAKVMVDNITHALLEKDPSNATFYQKNADNYKNRLEQLDNQYRSTLSSCKRQEIVYGGHYAFGYLAKRYGIQYLAAQGLSPDAEPTAKDLIALVAQIKKNNIPFIFYEELTSPKIAETLANETSAKMLLLNAAHNITKEDFENNISFLSIMEENLTNLSTGLDCKK
jgi:zinc transport system substrate-binding protein